MPAKQHTVLVCQGTGCASGGAEQILSSLEEARSNLGESVQIKRTGCHGFCQRDPLVVIEPESVFYSKVTPDDLPELVGSLLPEGKPVRCLFYHDPATDKPIAHYRDIPFYNKQQHIVLRNCGNIDPENINDYLAGGGYKALRKALVDNDARLSDIPTLVGLRQATGIGAMTNPIHGIENASCILAIGTNATQTHPIAGLKIKMGARNGAKLIIVNPREIDLCRLAHIWLRPYPGTNVALLMGMAKVIVDEGLLDSAFIDERCENFAEFRKSLEDFSLGRVEKITGVSRETIAEAAKIYATSKPAAVLWSAGITQHSHGTDNVLALANLALLTGNVGKPSSGLYPLWGENNAHGACDMGCLPDFYPGYQLVADSATRKKFEAAWGVKLNPEPGLTFTEIPQSTLEGQIKALYLIGSEPMTRLSDSLKVRQALEKAEFIVAQDIFLNETAQFANVVLPAASYAEKEGTFANAERRVQRGHKAIDPIGNSLPDWQIICQLAKRLGSKGFDFQASEEIMSEIALVAPIYGGISYERLEKEFCQWPCSSPEDPGISVLHAKQFHTPTRKAKFTPLEHKPSAEVPDIDYPLILSTERSLYDQGILSRKVEGLAILRSKEIVEINPKDAIDFGINDGNMVRVISLRGEIRAEAKVTDASPPGVVFMGFRFTETPIRALTNPVLDPVAKTPEIKACAVRLVP